MSPEAHPQKRPFLPWLGCVLFLALPAGVFLLAPADWPRWGFMWLLAFAIYAGCKALT